MRTDSQAPRRARPIASVLLAVGLWACGEAGLPAIAEREDLRTWWHENAELNDSTLVADSAVRRSTVYDVRVATAGAPDALYDSFVYMSIPRSGSEKRGYTHKDGAEFADEAGLTMSWTSFLYGADTWVHVELKQGPPLASADEVTIRPTTLDFRKELAGERTIRILVPYSENGHRFSVEFASQQLTSFKDGASGRLTTDPAAGAEVHTAPRNAILVFANPVPIGEDVARLVPDPSALTIYFPAEGEVSNLDQVTEEVIYFRPGTYYMRSDEHSYVRANVRWIYLAPGAYVKGAFQFRDGPEQFKVTGFGVVSGEKYVYETDRANQYRHRDPADVECHETCLKMLEFASGALPQQLTLHGITIAEPPYHSFVVHGHEQRFRMQVDQFKQVGGWYWQTDGLELYQGSELRNSFFHANDDVLKLYASNLRVEDVVVWKAENGPVIQWGWAPRNIHDVRVNGVDIIHNRMYLPAHNSCILNSARHFLDPGSSSLADPDTLVRDLFFENIRSEGRNLCAMRLYALSSWENINIINLWIEEWNALDHATQASKFEALWSPAGERVRIGNEVHESRGVGIENYTVQGERIRKADDNWQAHQTGRLDFDASLWENWNAW